MRKGNSYASKMYGVSLSSVKRWRKRYDGTWQSLKERSHRPHSHPQRHTPQEEELIRQGMDKAYFRYGWEGAYMVSRELGYRRSYSGFLYAARRMGLCGGQKEQKPSRKQDRRYPELLTPGEKVQVDVKEIPYNCLRGRIRENGKHLYQWTAIDACTRVRFVYAFEEHTPENSVKFLRMLQKAFPFRFSESRQITARSSPISGQAVLFATVRRQIGIKRLGNAQKMLFGQRSQYGGGQRCIGPLLILVYGVSKQRLI